MKLTDLIDTRHLDYVVRRRSGGRDLRVSKPHSKKPRHPIAAPSLLTNEKFMSASQKRAHRAGEEIWV